MSHSLNISEALRRPIQNGSSFSAYIKDSTCKPFDYGNGNNSTIEGVEFMADLIKKSSYQVKKLAKKLKKSTVESTVNSVHSFLTTYIQYDADAQLQRLRSPGCSWSVRKTGIDCKSFSIFAGALLSEMGISFALRQIKQPSFYPDQYTHVYVVVPNNQKITSATQMDSYYNLDATVLDNKEVVYIAKKDKFMNGLPYQGMMAPTVSVPKKETTETKNFERSFAHFEQLGFSRSDLGRMKEYMKDLQASTASSSRIYMVPRKNGLLITNGSSGFVFKPAHTKLWQNVVAEQMRANGLNAVGTLTAVTGAAGLLKDANIGDLFGDVFGSINDLIGGLFGSDRGWYKPDYVKRDAETLLGFLSDHTKKINQALVSQNMSQLGRSVADFKAEINVYLKAVKAKKNEGWNTPTMENLDLLINGLEKLKSRFVPKLDQWISQYFNRSGSIGSKTMRSDKYDSLNEGNSPVYLGNPQAHTEQIPNLSIKQGVGSVKSFDLSGSGKVLLEGIQPTNPSTGGGKDTQYPNPTTPNYPTPANPSNGGSQQDQIDNEVQKASLIPGFSNTALIATGSTLVAGVLLWPTIKKAIK